MKTLITTAVIVLGKEQCSCPGLDVLGRRYARHHCFCKWRKSPMDNITIAIPAKNEAISLDKLLPQLTNELPNVSILVVNDFSIYSFNIFV